MNKLKEWIESRGIKQSWLAKQTGITQSWLNRLVNGSTPNVRDAQKIARALGTTVDVLWPLEERGQE